MTNLFEEDHRELYIKHNNLLVNSPGCSTCESQFNIKIQHHPYFIWHLNILFTEILHLLKRFLTILKLCLASNNLLKKHL